MPKTFSALALFLFVAFAALIARAQTPTVSISAWIDRGDCAGAPKFEPTLDGKPASVEQLADPTSDQIILIVLDLTGDLSRIDAAKQAMINDISKLPRNTWVGLLRDPDGLRVLADPTPNRQKVIDAIRSLSINGTPGLLETVRPALLLADSMIRKSPVRVSVFYITDGSIYDYREDYTDPVINPSDNQDLSRRFRDVLINEKISKLVGHISSLQAPLFVVDLDYRQDRLNLAYQSGLETLTRTTGGEVDMCHSMAEIPAAISRIFARITSAWWVTLAVPAKTQSHLQIGLNASCGKGNLQLSWRSHFRLKEE
jgi:von Willebrand factor type A domain